MKWGVLAAVLVLFAMSAKADMVVRDGTGNILTLHNEQCVAAPWLKGWKTATFVYDGKTFAACWREQQGTIVVLDSAGDVTPVPAHLFKRETGV